MGGAAVTRGAVTGAAVSRARYLWRATARRCWRHALLVALLGGLLGSVALGAVAGARRTATAYGRYLTSIRASDAFVNVPGKLPAEPVLRPIRLISQLSGVVSSATYIGLSAAAVIHGRIDHSFTAPGINGSLNGEYFRQDRMTVLAGRLPPLSATSQIVVTPAVARAFGVGVGGQVTYAFQRLSSAEQPVGKPVNRVYRVAAIVAIPPVLVDASDQNQEGILPPGATRQVLPEYGFAWVAVRLARGTAGIPALQQELDRLARVMLQRENRITGQPGSRLSFSINRPDIIRQQVQQSIRPEAVALTIFGGIAALAMLVLVGQGLTQLISRSAPDVAALRMLGVTRRQAALAAALPGMAAITGGVALAVAGAVALSPLAPVGPVRNFDPDRGIRADGLVLGVGAAALAMIMLSLLAVLAARSARRRTGPAIARPSAVALAAARAGLPAAAVIGCRNALEPGSGTRAAPVRSALLGAVAAVTSVVTTVVFGASLTGLVSHPARYGWDWDIAIQSQGGYGLFLPGVMSRLISGQRPVAGWSEFSFGQLPIDGQVVPVMGVRRDLGTVQPPTTSGRPMGSGDQIELGNATLRELGKNIGDTVRFGRPPFTRTLTITGTVTLPSFGLATGDHVSLGRGAMLPEQTLLAAEGLPRGHKLTRAIATGLDLPSAVAIDLAPGTTAAQRARLIHRIVAARPDGFPGGTYELRGALASAVLYASQMGGQPLALALGLTAGALLSLVLTVLSSVRRRRQELALLKTLGMTRTQIRAVIGWQTTVTLLIAVAVGLPLGIAAGRLAWHGFAGSLGAVPVTEVPLGVLIAGAVALAVAGNLLTSLPAAIAARTRAAALLRAQ